MSRAVRETDTDEIQEIIKNYKGPGFRFVGRNFYAQFLAVNDIGEIFINILMISSMKVPLPSPSTTRLLY